MSARAPLILTCRALRKIHVDGEMIAPGELVPMITDLALAALGAGSVEIVGPEAGFVRVNAAYSWGAPNPEPARQQTTSEWMRPTGSTASSEPQRVVPAMELAAQRWQR